MNALDRRRETEPTQDLSGRSFCVYRSWVSKSIRGYTAVIGPTSPTWEGESRSIPRSFCALARRAVTDLQS
jgi:hypothetical protein